MQAGVARGVVDEDTSVLVGNPPVREGHIHHVTDILATLGNEEIAARLCDNARGIVECCHVHI